MKVIYVREKLFDSILKDTYTFACIGAMFFLNYKLCGNSKTIYAICIILFIFTLFAKSPKEYSPVEAEEVLKKLIEDKKEIGK